MRALQVRAPRLVLGGLGGAAPPASPAADPTAPSASSSASAGGEQVAALDMGHITFVRSGMGESAPSEAAANDESDLELYASNGPAGGGGGGMRARSNSSFDDDALGAARSFSAPLDRSVQAAVYDTYEVRLRDMEALLLSCVDGRLHAPSGEPVLLERFDVAVTATTRDAQLPVHSVLIP